MKPTKTITQTINAPITIDELANWFWMIDTEGQIEFFNELAKQSRDWHGTFHKAKKDLAKIDKAGGLSIEAKELIDVIAGK